MINRNLRTALLISLGIHVFVMAAVVIVVPKSMVETRSYYARIDFLGPILRKTAFDMMLENVNSAGMFPVSDYGSRAVSEKALNVSPPKRRPAVSVFPDSADNSMDMRLGDFFVDSKVVPVFITGTDRTDD